MVEALHEFLPDATFTTPAGGLFLWATLADGLDTTDLLAAALERNVAFVPGVAAYVDGVTGSSSMRLNFSACDEERIVEGVRRIGDVARERRAGPRARPQQPAHRALGGPVRVAVLAGGRSLERAVSQRSGARVELALTRLGHEPVPLDADGDLGGRLAAGGIDCAFVALHGRGGEDGTVQELLELAGVPYTGARPDACARRPTRSRPSACCSPHGLPTPPFAAVSSSAVRDLGADALLERVAERVGLPLVVKPARGGSSLGLRRVDDAEALPEALLSALAYDDRVLCERWVEGREVTVTVLRGEALPPVEAIPLDDHGYDFEARYTPGATEFAVPAEVGPEPAAGRRRGVRGPRLRRPSRASTCSCPKRPPWILEVNVVPGLTETSTAPLAAQAAGMTFEELVAALLEDAVAVG